MNIVTAQLNYTIGDFKGNLAKILGVIKETGDKADIIVFSELCLSGYYPKDLIERKGFMEAQKAALDEVLEASKHVQAAIVVGLITESDRTDRKHYNSGAFIHDGKVIKHIHKQLLPTYGVFDEDRHFIAAGPQEPFIWNGKTIGMLICEDAWFADTDNIYKANPVSDIEAAKPDLVISINASPHDIGKIETRYTLMHDIAIKCNAPVVYVNQVGGIDELIFDGMSMVVVPEGLLHMEPAFEESWSIVDMDAEPVANQGVSVPQTMDLITKQLVMGLRDYCHKSGFKKVVVGSSGGIDSAVTLALGVLALGAENVVAVTMPSKYSSAGSVDDSVDLCNALGIELVHAPIKATFDAEIQAYTEAFGVAPSPLAQENLQARIRGQRLMTYSNSTGAMVLSTGNKSEMAVGYCTIYGDMAGGISLIADLYKTQVYALAEHLNNEVFKRIVVPLAIIHKAPSAELAPDQKDTDSLPPYPSLDAFLKLFFEAHRLPEKERKEAEAVVALTMTKEDQARITGIVDKNEYKRRQAAPVIRVSKKAFGHDRQIPLTAKTNW